MKFAHSFQARIISTTPEEDALVTLITDSTSTFKEDENPDIEVDEVTGFQDETLYVTTWKCDITRIVNEFIRRLNEKLSTEDKQKLWEQKDRLDEELHLYLRLDKDAYEEGVWNLVQNGKCIHVKVHVAAYPAKKEKAYEKIKHLFGKGL